MIRENSQLKDSKGECAYCGQDITDKNAAKHFVVCPKRLAIIKKFDGKVAASETLYHLRVREACQSPFWLDLEMRGSATLKNLDDYLRAIWLDCCGHISQFSFGKKLGETISKKYSADEVFRAGGHLMHIYDFGTSSETLIHIVGVRKGKPITRHPILLMARNRIPESDCAECMKPAAKLCMECFIDEDTWQTFCDKHARSHPHGNYGDPVPLVNSPRLGLCGYEGPAEPPY